MGNQEFTITGNAYQVGAEIYMPNHYIGTPPVNDPNLYWEQVNHDAHGRHYILREHMTNKREGYRTDAEYETLRKQYSEAMIKAEILSDEVKLNHTLAGQHHKEFLELQQEHRNCEEQIKVQSENLLLQQKDLGIMANKIHDLKETLEVQNQSLVDFHSAKGEKCTIAEQSPEAKVYEDMHTKRMAAETESIELDNLLKRAEYNGYKDYPKSVWESVNRAVDNLSDRFHNRFTVVWGLLAAFAINEVIQWVTR